MYSFLMSKQRSSFISVCENQTTNLNIYYTTRAGQFNDKKSSPYSGCHENHQFCNSHQIWSHAYQLLLILLFNYFPLQGEAIPNSSVQRSFGSSSLAWHPSRLTVAIGWENGEIILWNEKDKELYQAAKLHKAEVCLLSWCNSGQRLLSADKVSLRTNQG